MPHSHRAPAQPHYVARATASVVIALALVVGAAYISTRPVPNDLDNVAPAPVEFIAPIGLDPAQLGQWCVDRQAAGTAGLSTGARNWLRYCTELFGAGLTPSPSPSSPSSPSPSMSPSPSTSPSPSPSASPNPGNPLSGLPLVPWEGGPAYWSQFPKAVAGGWTNPSFFPISIFHESFSSEGEVLFDKSYGVNSYIEGYPNFVQYDWLQRNGMYWLSHAPNSTFPPLTGDAAASAHWPGVFLDDEPDGRFPTAAETLTYVLNLLNANPENDRFRFINFTQIVASDYGPVNNEVSAQLLNSYRGPISADVYWYTIPTCNAPTPMLFGPVDTAHCRTSSSYGGLIKSLRQRDAADGVLKPIWQFIENFNGGPGGGPFYAYITPGQLKGAAMNSIINEARGLMWFNSSLSGPCGVMGLVLREEQVDPNGCPARTAATNAMREVNLLAQQLAPIINTQSYEYTFGPRLDTMLKWYAGSAYVFAMVNGAADSSPGGRTFTLPPGLSGVASVEVVNEGRTIPVTGGQFSDTFGAEYSYHIYKITP